MPDDNDDISDPGEHGDGRPANELPESVAGRANARPEGGVRFAPRKRPNPVCAAQATQTGFRTTESGNDSG
jgi:hypothetical protein